MTQVRDPQVEEVIEVERNRTRTGASRPSILEWCTLAVEDLAQSVEKLNQDIDHNRTNNVLWHDVWDLFSLRRWAFILPGGGAAGGGRMRRTRVRRAASAVPPRPRRAPEPAETTNANAVQPTPTATTTGQRVVIESGSFKDKR